MNIIVVGTLDHSADTGSIDPARAPRDPRPISMICKSAVLDLAVFVESCLKASPHSPLGKS